METIAWLPLVVAALAPVLAEAHGAQEKVAARPFCRSSEQPADPSAPSSEQTPKPLTFGEKQKPWISLEAKVIKAQPFAVRPILAEDELLKAQNDTWRSPAMVIAWVDKEICKLDFHFDEAAKGYAEYAEALKEREAKRKALYPLFAGALLRSCLDGNEEDFTERFCEWVWRSIACHPRESSRFPEVELFLRKFLAGKMAYVVTRGDLCGADLAPSVFHVFVAKLTKSGDRLDLDPKERKRIRDFLSSLLNRLEKAIDNDRQKFNTNEVKAQRMKEEVAKQAPWAKKI